jgi:hypothetical protein
MKKYLALLIMLASIIVLPFCKTTKQAAGKTKSMPAVTYTADIAPIMADRCTPCHFPETGKKKFLDTYTAVKTNIDDILVRVMLPKDDPKFMPFKSKKEPLSDSLIMVLKTWRETGMTE